MTFTNALQSKKNLWVMIFIMPILAIFLISLVSAGITMRDFNTEYRIDYWTFDSNDSTGMNGTVGIHNWSFYNASSKIQNQSEGCFSGTCINVTAATSYGDKIVSNYRITNTTKYPNGTLLFWFIGNNGYIGGRGVQGSTTNWLFTLDNCTSATSMIKDQSASYPITYYSNGDCYTSSYPVWSLLALVWNDSSSLIYYNGQHFFNYGGGTWETGTAVSVGDYLFGSYHTTLGYANQNFTIDEGAFINKSLSDAELTLLYRRVYINNLTHNTSRTLTSMANTEFFVLNLTYDYNLYGASKVDANLSYDGVIYPTIKTASGNNMLLTSNVSIPKLLSMSSNKTFYWIIKVTNPTGIGYTLHNSTFYNQTITDDINNMTYANTTYSTQKEYFNLSLSYNNTIITAISAKLWYNNTAYTSTKSGTFDNTIFTATPNAPALNYPDNVTFFWQLAITNSTGTSYVNTSSANQSVDWIRFQICNSTISIPFINYTFQDERNSTTIQAKLGTGTFYYYLNNASVNKTYTYSNLTTNYNYTFCFYPPQKQVYVNQYFTYYNTNYPQRSYDPLSFLYSNSTNNTLLYLLFSDDGQYVTFQVVNNANQPLSDVLVSAYNPSSGLIESKYTDSSGGVTFWLDPLTTYTIIAEKTGYTSASFSVTPTNTEYTIQLGTSTTSTTSDYTKGISITLSPTTGSTLYNNTDYKFEFNISSSYWSLDGYGFILKNASGTELNSTSGAAATGGSINVYANTQNYTTIIIDYYYVVNSTYINSSASWNVQRQGLDSWSIKNLIDDIKLFKGQGMFGMNDFTLTLMAFLILIFSAGIMSYKFGFTGSGAIMVVIFALVLMLDVGLGLIPNPLPFRVDYFPTIFTAIIMVAYIFWEATR